MRDDKESELLEQLQKIRELGDEAANKLLSNLLLQIAEVASQVPSPAEDLDYEKRAEAFKQEVLSLEQSHEVSWHYVSFSIEDTLSARIQGYDALQKLISTEIDLPVTPQQLADELDLKSASSQVIGVSIILDSKSALKTVVETVLKIAEKYGGIVDTSMPFQTLDMEDYIRSIHDPVEGRLHHFDLQFVFS